MTQRMKTQVLEADRKEFEQKVHFLKMGSQINILCSFTYITPNYDVLCTLNELYKFSKSMKFKVFLIMWDMNVLANPYFERYCAHKVKDPEQFLEGRIQEIRSIAKSIGFNDDTISLYKSSDLWRRLIFYKEENLFQQFFSTLSRIHLKDFEYLRKASHLFQISLDIFFFAYFNKLYPENSDEEMDIIFSDYYKNNVYIVTRNILIEAGLLKERPILLLMETVPYIMYDERVPEWNMKLEEIKYIFMHAQNPIEEKVKLLKYFNDAVEISVRSSHETIVEALSKEVHDFLQHHKNKFVHTGGGVCESVRSIVKRGEAKEIGNILRSNIYFDILLLSDGSKNLSQIAKELKKSLATISSYSGKLKRLGLVAVDSEGKMKRCVKGIKVNFEMGF